MLIIKSDIPSDQQSEMPDKTCESVLALQYQLEKSQWYSPQTIQLQQFKKLLPLLLHAKLTVPYYKKSLSNLMIDTNSNINVDLWKTIPILTRDDVRDRSDELTSPSIPPEHGQVFDVSSSGSTGKPIKIKSTALSAFMWQAGSIRDHIWHGRDLDKKLAVIRRLPDGIGACPDGDHYNNWGRETRDLCVTGALSVLDIRAKVDEQYEWLSQVKPDYLLTYPSNMMAIAQYINKFNKQPILLQEIRTIGEMLTTEMRQDAQKIFNTKITDLYSCQEAGYIALQCPQGTEYHIQSENVFVEILDEKGNDCQPGETGRVIISSLNNYATPLIRYEIGDYAEVGSPCACGRGLMTLKAIKGRIRNMLIHPDGKQEWVVNLAGCFTNIVDIDQFQFVQNNKTELEVYLVTKNALTVEQEQNLIKNIQERLGKYFNITIKYTDQIKRGKGGKFEDFISNILT